ncbi:hypothetical protein CYMTET_19217 [Cymbomonas tetramitiformis]|uniref:Uncharacterized protein n=1 Tax=Cymbomonas tetramitiformis TaxID=36881 RepID=A0AAE0G6Z6_9CHLO|nr:hypothetical protein CYMTET_19217 [Cymbomonas tetramitiformis]
MQMVFVDVATMRWTPSRDADMNADHSSQCMGADEPAGTLEILDFQSGSLLPAKPVFIASYSGSVYDRMENSLGDPKFSMFVGPSVIPYKNYLYFWASYDVVIKLMQTSVVTLVNVFYEDAHLYYANAISVLGLTVHCYCQPFISSEANFVMMVSYVTNVLCTLGYIATDNSDNRSDVMGYSLVSCQMLFLAITSALMARWVIPLVTVAMKDAQFAYKSIYRGRTA